MVSAREADRIRAPVMRLERTSFPRLILFTCVLLLLAAEWILRKRARLV